MDFSFDSIAIVPEFQALSRRMKKSKNLHLPSFPNGIIFLPDMPLAWQIAATSAAVIPPPFFGGQVESIIKEQLSYSNYSFVRVGKSLIINMDELICVNITKQTLEMSQPSGEKLLFNTSREALKKIMNFLIENKKNGMVRNINMRLAQPSGSGLLRGHKQTMISDSDIRVIC